MSLLKSKGFWLSILTTIVVIAAVNRIGFLRALVYPAPASN